jgi:tRNA pseudouridine38-40 synthase
MARFKIVLEYEGTRYRGWQIQKNARTVQGELARAIREFFRTERFEFQGAGRTDAGVHALHQVAHFDVETILEPAFILTKLNEVLPADINILGIRKASPRFHARYNAVARSYLYQISRRRTALGKRFVWWVKDDLDAERMREALTRFLGMRDFFSFTEDDPEDKSTKVLVEETALKEEGDLILIRLVGSHFVWKLVRRIVGVVVEAGKGKLSIDEIMRFLREKSGEPARLTAPPSGLFLERVYFKGDDRLKELRSAIPIASRPR